MEAQKIVEQKIEEQKIEEQKMTNKGWNKREYAKKRKGIDAEEQMAKKKKNSP